MWLSRLSSVWVLVPAVAVIVLLAWWWRTRDRRAQRALVVAGVLLVLACLFELLRPETPGEAMERKIRAMSEAVAAKDVDKILQDVSETFDLERQNRLKKAGLRMIAQRMIDNGELTSVEVWKFKDAKVTRAASGGNDTGTIEFLVKPKGPNIPDGAGYRCIAVFVFDDDRQWRLQSFEVFHFNSTQRLPIPY
jgi:hypothetical protein